MVWQFRDVSWRRAFRAKKDARRTGLQPQQAEKLCEIFVEPLRVVQNVISLVGGKGISSLLKPGIGLELQDCLNRTSPATLLGLCRKIIMCT